MTYTSLRTSGKGYHMLEGSDALRLGQAALRKADWPTAKACFESCLLLEDDPEAHDGLGIALWWLIEIQAAHQQRTKAFIGFKNNGNTGGRQELPPGSGVSRYS